MYYEDFRSRNSLLLEQFAQGVSVVRFYIDLVCKHGAKARQTSDHFLLPSPPRDKSIPLPQNTDRFRKNLWYGSILKGYAKKKASRASGWLFSAKFALRAMWKHLAHSPNALRCEIFAPQMWNIRWRECGQISFHIATKEQYFNWKINDFMV